MLTALRERLRCEEIWVVGADRYRNPDEDLPQDFEERRVEYYRELGRSQDAGAFFAELREQMVKGLRTLNAQMPHNPKVRILWRDKHRISIAPFEPLPPAPNLEAIKAELERRWPMTDLWDQNLMAEWHVRYQGGGVMIYWHMERQATCIYSQLKRCSSSEVSAMIEGELRHCTDMDIQHHYVDSHGQSEVAFAFRHLLGSELAPRLKAIARQKLYLPTTALRGELGNLAPILTREINWPLIERQYDVIIKYTTALRRRTADPEAILRRFARAAVQHPTYARLAELGKVIKTIFLCRYIGSENPRREIHSGLNVVENWNGAHSFIFFGKGGEVASYRLEDQELSMLALHLLQNCMVYTNTLMLQRVLTEPAWLKRMTPEDHRGLNPGIHSHLNPMAASIPILSGGSTSTCRWRRDGHEEAARDHPTPDGKARRSASRKPVAIKSRSNRQKRQSPRCSAMPVSPRPKTRTPGPRSRRSKSQALGGSSRNARQADAGIDPNCTACSTGSRPATSSSFGNSIACRALSRICCSSLTGSKKPAPDSAHSQKTSTAQRLPGA